MDVIKGVIVGLKNIGVLVGPGVIGDLVGIGLGVGCWG